ncbi:MAG: hypothetical protein K2W95_03485 [Candidatus Obscuribacterales bacterium]|nr:hypothetical protein [Candidatus Obscuribacterales bacterium]
MEAETQAPQPAPANKTGAIQVVLLVTLLLIGTVSGGYFVGTQMNFKNMKGGDAPASGADEVANFGGFSESKQLKKAYWIHTRGEERVYKISVFINDQFLGKFYKPNVDLDATKYIKPGRNTIKFIARPLPMDQRVDYSGAYLEVQLKAGDKKGEGENAQFSNGDTLLTYTRKVTDTEEFTDSKEFETLE